MPITLSKSFRPMSEQDRADPCICPPGFVLYTPSGVRKDLSGQRWPQCCQSQLAATMAQQAAMGHPMTQYTQQAAVEAGTSTALYLIGGVALLGIGYWVYRAMK